MGINTQDIISKRDLICACGANDWAPWGKHPQRIICRVCGATKLLRNQKLPSFETPNLNSTHTITKQDVDYRVVALFDAHMPGTDPPHPTYLLAKQEKRETIRPIQASDR